MQNWQPLSEIFVAVFANQDFAFWRQRLKTFSGQWAPVQSFQDLVADPQPLANGMLAEVEAVDGGEKMRIARGPVQFNQTASPVRRAPQASEHTESFLLELGLDWERLEALKTAGVIT